MVFSVRGETTPCSGNTLVLRDLSNSGATTTELNQPVAERRRFSSPGRSTGSNPLFKGHEVLQVLFTNLRPFERHVAKAVAFSAVVVDIPEGLTSRQRNAQLAFIELAVKVALTQGNAGQLFLKWS
jgi:hypothetical protein